MEFADLKKGMAGRISSVPTDRDDVQRLFEMGLVEGTEFKVIKIAPLGDPMEISLRGYRLCVRKQEMRGFGVEVV
jgi:ferrous iron transport protein A